MNATPTQRVDPSVTAFLALLAQANSVNFNDALLSSWDVSAPNGEPDNEVARFANEGTDESMILTEGGIASGKWVGESFFCVDHEGDDVQLSLYRHTPITPPACKQCGTPLHGDYCSDNTCVFSCWPQSVSAEDLSIMATDRVEDVYGCKKREPQET